MIIYSPSRSPSTSIRNRQNQRARYISGRAYWDLVETQIKISIGRDRQVEPNTDLDLSRDQIPISETGYIPSKLIFRYGYWWRGLWLGEFVILSVLRILLGFCIYAASQIHDSSHCRTRCQTPICHNWAVLYKAPPGGLRSGAQRHEARGFGGLPPF